MDRPPAHPLVGHLARAASRRDVMRGLVAALTVTTAARMAPTAARHKHCGTGEKRCGKRCVRGSCCPGKPCGPTRLCQCVRTVDGDAFCAANEKVLCIQCSGGTSCSTGEA